MLRGVTETETASAHDVRPVAGAGGGELGGRVPAPHVVIVPGRSWTSLRLREIWQYRELLYFFVWRDVKVRYKQTAFGAAWAVIQPFLLMVVFSVFLGRLAGVPSDGLPYPIFSYTALVPWTLFASSLAGAAASLVAGGGLVSKIYFPRILLPVASAGSYLLDFAIAMGLLVGMMAWYDIYPGAALAWLPAFVALALLTALGVGIWLSALNVRYRDVRYAVPFLVQLWLFASPVAYPASEVPEGWQTVYGLNPMTGVVEGFRWALLDGPAPAAGMVAASAGVAVALLAIGLVYFRRTERTFADVI
jgi:lipopolysaccharide transport system permease protein